MLSELLRFNRLATALAERGDGLALAEPLGDFLDRNRFGPAFRDGYLLPMIACIWSSPVDQMLQFPVATLIRFCHNHGLLQVEDRPAWFTVKGGSQAYVRALTAQLPDVRAATPVTGIERRPDGVIVRTRQAASSAARAATHPAGHPSGERFDAVVMACHAPQALALLGADATPGEASVLGAMRTQPNEAVLHTDASLMPQARKAWAAWNFERAGVAPRHAAAAPSSSVCLHYWINRLQPLPFAQPVIVSLNPIRAPRPETVIARRSWAHPVFDQAAIDAQQRLGEIQGVRRTWFSGAWCGYGFHEDGLRAGQEAARQVLEQVAASALRQAA